MTYSPDEARDEKGQWAAGSGDGIKRPAERGVKKLSGSPTQLAKQLEAKYPGQRQLSKPHQGTQLAVRD